MRRHAAVGGRFLSDLHLRVFRHLLRLPLSFYERQRNGSLVARAAGDKEVPAQFVRDGRRALVSGMLLLAFGGLVLGGLFPLLLGVCLLAASPV